MGRSEVLVYPRGILKELKLLCGGEPLGVFDPKGNLKRVLAQNGIEIFDLKEEGFESFQGPLAILDSFPSTSAGSLPSDVNKLSKKGVATVWIQPTSESHAKLTPSFYAVPGKATVIIAQAELLHQLEENPRAQLNLLELARLASRRADQAFPNLADHN